MNRNNRVALVTGAARGIGRTVAVELAKQGAVLALVDREESGLRQVQAELAAAGLRCGAYAVDVTDSSSVNAAVERVENELGPIYALVNAAGVLRMGDIAAYRDEDWAATFAVNTMGVFYVSRAVVGRMITREEGSIVTVSSNAAAVPRMGMAAYAASKAAATHFTKCLGLEVAQYRIRCNVVSPGSTDTDMLRSMWTNGGGPEQTIAGSLEAYKTGIPLRRLAEPDDIADAVLFLLSDAAKHITMHDLRVDGGATLGV
nr:2,3-dihydro-2,3-dihydroxybenzoate dehydrogenase [Paenibacillus turpanensis]